MNLKPLMLAAVTIAFAGTMFAQQKVATINIQAAILGTKEGQKAAADLGAKFQPKQKELEGKKAEIDQKRQQLNASSNTISEDARTKLAREIDGLTKALNREGEDYEAMLQAEQNKVLGDLYQRLNTVIQRYAKDNNIGVVLDTTQQSNIVYVSDATDITQDVVALYDKAASAPAVSPAPAGGAPAAPKKPAPAKP